MYLPLTYGQRLRKIMQHNHLTVNDLCRKMGYRSPTQFNRILNDEVSPALITKFHHQFMLIFDWLISPAEIKALSASLQLSCLGEDSYLTRRAMHHMLFERPLVRAQSIPVQLFPETSGASFTFDGLMREAAQYKQIELIIIGSSYDPLFPLFSQLSSLFAPGQLTIRHYFVMEENPSRLIAQIAALEPFLNTSAYHGVYCTETEPDAASFLQCNAVAIARGVRKDGSTGTTTFLPPQKGGVAACKMKDDTLFSFIAHQLSLYQDQLRPIKSVYAQPKTVQSLLTLCQRDLFLEQNRENCFLRLDLCFHALPTEIVLKAVDSGARLGLSLEDPLMQELIRVHSERYNNLLHKAEPTYIIMSPVAMKAFAETGHISDHLFAMRDFTPQERKAILLPLLDALRANDNLHVHLFRDETVEPVSCFCAYADVGLQISANHTAYNVAQDHGEVFVGLPALAQTFTSYCVDTLIPESCLSREESLAWLIALAEGIPEE